jgi:hypothetical protein
MPANAEAENRTEAGLQSSESLRPALLAPYGDLAQLRYDFPVVLIDKRTGGAVQSLTSVINELLQKIAPAGPDSEQLRKMVLNLEREIRTLLRDGTTGTLTELWDQASARIAEHAGALFGQSVRIARAALDIDGPCIDCDAGISVGFIGHIWEIVQEGKARDFRASASRLAVKLDDILRSDFLRSAAGRSVESLKAAIGAPHQDLFDFALMSRLALQTPAGAGLSETRRRRIEWALWVLKRQRFFAGAAGQSKPADAVETYLFKFESCADALAAYRARLPEMVDLIKAMAIAELEIDGRYVESRHDAYFDHFDAGMLSTGDTHLFPDYLVVLGGAPVADNAGLLDALSSGLPLKVVVNIDDLVEEGPSGNGHFAFGLRSAQLAGLAAGLGEVFVLQSASSNLYQMRERIFAGQSYRGPALFSVFTGIPGNAALPRYLTAAAAMQARAFPAFSYDPSAGTDLAACYSLENNPDVDADWTVQPIEYADENLQRASERIAFTFVDFLAADPRYARHFRRVARPQWNDRMVPLAACLAPGYTAAPNAVPYVWASDADGTLVRLAVDERAIAAARRSLDNWHRLQESGGVHNSHADRLLAREKAAWEEQRKREDLARAEQVVASTAPVATAAAPAPATFAAPVAPAAPPEPARSSDDPYIETSRCSSCNECVQVNAKLFAYNENKQAYIANADAGTYRQLVEAAENCQLGIIHPGKPRNKSEAGLDELTQRAAAFN